MANDVNVSISDLYRDIVKIATMVEVPSCNEEAVWQTLRAYEEFYTGSSVAVRTTSVPKEHRDLSVRYFETAVQHDPYQIALDSGVYTPVGHPIENLLPEILEKLNPMGCGVDLSVRHGFEKIWPVLTVSSKDLAKLRWVPESVRTHLDFYEQFGLVWIGILGLDYTSKTFNIYWIFKDPSEMPEQKVIDICRTLGFAVPEKLSLEVLPRLFTMYTTYSWTSPRIERLSFAMAAPAAGVPTDIHPVFKCFVEDIPLVADQRFFTFNTCYTRQGDYLKIEADYKGILGNAVRALFDALPS